MKITHVPNIHESPLKYRALCHSYILLPPVHPFPEQSPPSILCMWFSNFTFSSIPQVHLPHHFHGCLVFQLMNI